MSIVAISQTLGSLGDEIGHEMAWTLKYEFADREIILQAAERFGEGVTDLAHVTEERPTLAERFTQSRQRYLACVEAIVFEMAARDNVVLSGRGVTFILNRVRHALRVRVTAPERVRAKRVEHQHRVIALWGKLPVRLVCDLDRAQAAAALQREHVRRLETDRPLRLDDAHAGVLVERAVGLFAHDPVASQGAHCRSGPIDINARPRAGPLPVAASRRRA